MADKAPSAVQQLLAQGPPSGAAAAQRHPIGVPDDYKVVKQTNVRTPGLIGPPAPVAVSPRYFEGMEYDPASLAPEMIVQLQGSLAKAGLIGPKDKYRYGVWDDVTRTAYRQALELANASGVDDKTAISMYANSPERQPQVPDRPPLVKKLPNPTDLRDTFNTVARAKYGHAADDATVNRMVAAFQQSVGNEQQAVYDAQGMVTPSTVTETPDPQTFAEQQLTAADPNAVAAHDATSIYGDFLKLMNRGATGG